MEEGGGMICRELRGEVRTGKRSSYCFFLLLMVLGWWWLMVVVEVDVVNLNCGLMGS